MSANGLCRFLKVRREYRAAVLLHQLLLGRPLYHHLALFSCTLGQQLGIYLRRLEAQLLYGILAGIAFRAHELVHAAVWARCHDAVLQQDGGTVLRAYHGGGLVAVLEAVGGAPAVLLDVCRAIHRLCVHRHERLHPVATVQVQCLCYGAEAVRRVDIAAMCLVEVHAPVVPVLLPVRVEVVQVCALGMQDFAEQSVLCHVQSRQLKEVIAAVLQLHAVPACALRGVDEQPDVVERRCRRHLYGGVLAVLHGIDSHRHVVHPVGGYVDQVYVVAPAQLPVYGVATAVGRRLGQTCTAQYLLAGIHVLRHHVTQGNDLRPWYVREAFHGTRSPHAQSHESHAHGVERGSRELQHVCLSGRAFGHCHSYWFTGSAVVLGPASRRRACGNHKAAKHCCADSSYHVSQMFLCNAPQS